MDARNNRRQEGGSSVVTANRLRDGRVVWLTAETGWSHMIEHAELFANDAIDAAIERAREAERQRLVVDLYGVAVSAASGRPEPVTARERIRAHGPSVRPDFSPSRRDGEHHGS